MIHECRHEQTSHRPSLLLRKHVLWFLSGVSALSLVFVGALGWQSSAADVTANAPGVLLAGTACTVDCQRVTYDLSIVNPDNSVRTMRSSFAHITQVDAQKQLVRFDDDGFDRDFDDLTLMVNRPSCETIIVQVMSVKAARHHEIHLLVSYDGLLQQDIVLGDDSHAMTAPVVVNVNDYPSLCAVTVGDHLTRIENQVYAQVTTAAAPVSFIPGTSQTALSAVLMHDVRAAFHVFGKRVAPMVDRLHHAKKHRIAHSTTEVDALAAAISIFPSTVTTPVPEDCPALPEFTTTLRVGSSGDEVTALHGLLRCKGFMDSTAPVTDTFTTITRQSVLRMQMAEGLVPTGMLDKPTRQAIQSW